MATRGWESVTQSDLESTAARSKYRNVKVRTADHELFDSQRELAYWQGLQARQAAGAITNLRRQVAYPLLCPIEDRAVMVSSYVADFVYDEAGVRHVVDVKGVRTAIYKLKKKWLHLQDGIVIEEV
jgi:Protein of unknown function (DUF1064)